jgi:hypothetical protein
MIYRDILMHFTQAPAPVFILLYIPCQFLTITLISLTLGSIRGRNGVFDGDSFLFDLVERPGDTLHIVLVLISGFFNANGDFLCACACSKLPGSVANLIYGGWGLIQGTLLTFLVEKYDGNLVYLFCGIFTAMLGVLSMSASDYNSVDPTSTISKLSMDFNSSQTDEFRKVLMEDPAPHSILQHESEPCNELDFESVKVVRKYVYLCLLAGVMTGLFVPLSVLASRGDSAVDNPYVLMFCFKLVNFWPFHSWCSIIRIYLHQEQGMMFKVKCRSTSPRYSNCPTLM